MTSQETSSLDIQFRLASAWQKKGRLEQAMAGYRQILRVEPGYLPAAVKLGDLLEAEGNFVEAATTFRLALVANPNDAELHKRFINVLSRQQGPDAAFDAYCLERQDGTSIDPSTEEILCCVVVRNERVRLPYFLEYYRQKGVTRFLVVDNDSTDQTLDFLLDQPDVHVWRSTYSYHKSYYGTAWIELLLRRYGINHWCLIVDADELLYYPDCEKTSLAQLCQRLDTKNKRAFKAILLDMYAATSIKDTHYTEGQDFLSVCPYFDRQFFHGKYQRSTPQGNQTIYVGGARERVFGKRGDYYLSKVPLIKYNTECTLSPHWTNLSETDTAVESGCLLHFKYFASFPAYVVQEVERKEHFGHLFQYESYAQAIAKHEGLSLFDETQSIRFQDSQQLVQLGIMQIDQEDRQ